MTLEQVLDVARAGAQGGVLRRPCSRWATSRSCAMARRARRLAALGHATTLSYLEEVAGAVLRETGLLPHINAGVMGRGGHRRGCAAVSVEPGPDARDRIAERLSRERRAASRLARQSCRQRRLETIRLAGELRRPVYHRHPDRHRRDPGGADRGTDSRFATCTCQYGHIQEVIVQNFKAKPGTRMAAAAEPDLDDLLWTIAAARILLGPAMNIQAPPNLTGDYGQLIAAGINDWGGVSPVTRDHVNPEAPWPHLDALRRETAAAGKVLVARLPVYPEYVAHNARWQDAAVTPALLRAADSSGWARFDLWAPGLNQTPVPPPKAGPGERPDPMIRDLVAKAADGAGLAETEIETLFAARGVDFEAVVAAADALRSRVNGDVVTYAVNRNINYTNICTYKCRFCAFSKGKTHEALRGAPYDLDLEEVQRRAVEAWDRGATEVCMQGGIHPDYTGETYIALCRAVKQAVPGMHIHAFSSLEIQQGAATLGLPVAEYLLRLKEAGLGTLPGTAAEILDDEIRDVLCHDKLNTQQWLDTIETAHGVGFRTTATIMFGHIETPRHWARHLLRIRALQARTGGFTEFVPLPFVHMEAPMYLKGMARKGPTFRETVLMHAVARLALHPVLTNIQVSWVKLGRDGARVCLNAGANDLGGTLMNESITAPPAPSTARSCRPRRWKS